MPAVGNKDEEAEEEEDDEEEDPCDVSMLVNVVKEEGWLVFETRIHREALLLDAPLSSLCRCCSVECEKTAILGSPEPATSLSAFDK